MGLFNKLFNTDSEVTFEKTNEEVFVLSNQKERIENPTKEDIKEYVDNLFNEQDQTITLSLSKATNKINYVKAFFVESNLIVQLELEEKNQTKLVERTFSTNKECLVVFYQFYDYGIVDNVELYKPVNTNKIKSITHFDEKEYKVFEMFRKEWALVTAGKVDHYNTCTIGWGSLGTLWTRSHKGMTMTVYVHPARYTCNFLKENDCFTVSFFDEKYKKQLAYLGSHSGRDEDKVSKVGFTPISIQGSTTFKEAKATFVCKKLYQHEISKSDLAQEIQDYYMSKPESFPVDENNEWHAHYLFIGEIIDVVENEIK